MHVVKVLQGFQEEWSGKEEGWRENADVTSRLKLSVFRLAAKRAQELSRSSRFSPQEKKERFGASLRAELPPVRKVNTAEFCRYEITLWFL